MAYLGGFDASKIPEQEEFKPLPAGQYTAIIVSSENKPTKSGDGEMLVVEWKIQDAKHKGRSVRQYLNLKHRNDVAVEIARRDLASICRAVNVLVPSDSTDLHGIPCTITLAVSADCKWNEIKRVSPLVAATQPVNGGSGNPAEPSSKPAWMA